MRNLVFYLLCGNFLVYIMQYVYVCREEGEFGEETAGGETETGWRGGGPGEESREDEHYGEAGKVKRGEMYVFI